VLGVCCRGIYPGAWRILVRFGLRCGGLFRSIRIRVGYGVLCLFSRGLGLPIYLYPHHDRAGDIGKIRVLGSHYTSSVTHNVLKPIERKLFGQIMH
jgi:hypothetical protein